MIEIELKDKDHLDLCDILKIAQLCSSGGVAKHIIASGVVTVDGVVETRKRCKIRKNQIIKYDGKEIKLV
jgi:ribosome-associated protein